MSSSGGLHEAFKRGEDAGCDSMLVFTKSNRQWNAKPITDEEVALYREAVAKYGRITPVAVHASYLINVASPDETLWEKSYQSLKDEVERAARYGIPYLTFHPGSYMDSDEATGLANITRAMQRLLVETATEAVASADTAPNVTICLETMAGQGTNLGHRFEHLATILDGAGRPERLGVCFDTCHVFAAGYDIRTPEAYAQTLAEFDRVIGLGWIKCFHFNDSVHELGSRKDRHAHVGEGHIGREGFANFLNDPRWADFPAHLETPKTETNADGFELDMDIENLARLRKLVIG
jgi:deoxyribonuclease-4